MSTTTVHALSTGHLSLPERFFIKPSDPKAIRTVPSLSFLIQHYSKPSDKPTRIIFDLGLRRSTSLYPVPLQKHCASRSPMSTTPDVVESLAQGGLTVDDIDYVIFSHVHYDHVGYPKDFTNPNTTFIVGPGALALLSGEVKLDIGAHSFFEADLLPLDRTIELSSPTSSTPTPSTPATTTVINLTSYTPLDPFTHTLPLFSDNSISIIPAPGHLPGHINLLCRTSPSTYVLLAGDAYHDERLIAGTHSIATWTDETGRNCCIHADVPEAVETIKRIRRAAEQGIEVDVDLDQGLSNGRSNDSSGKGDGDIEKIRAKKGKATVEVVFAHDYRWEEEAIKKGRFWPGRL